MNASTFVPTLSIGVGEDACFFTMRESHLVYIPSPGPYGNSTVNGVYQGTIKVSSHHLFNLSQNPAEAYEKALAYAGQVGMVLTTPRDRLADDLNEIIRSKARSHEEKESADLAKIAERAAADAAWAARRLMEQNDLLNANRMPVGTQAGELIVNADVGFLNWIVSKAAGWEVGCVMHALAEKLVADFPELLFAKVTSQDYIGVVGKRMDITGQVTRIISFDGDWGMVYYVTIVTSNGECVLTKGGWNEKVGARVTIKATVKAHDGYKGQNQTVVNRVKTLTVEE